MNMTRCILLSFLLCPQVVKGGLLRGSANLRGNTNGRTYFALQPISSQQQQKDIGKRGLVGLQELVGHGSSPLKDYFPLQSCEGDCDSDDEVRFGAS